MVCEHCYGKGERGSIAWNGTKVCPECQGSGIVSCCDTAGAALNTQVEGSYPYNPEPICSGTIAWAGASADVSVESLFDGMRMIRETFKTNISERAKSKP